MAVPPSAQPAMNDHWNDVTQQVTGTNVLRPTTYRPSGDFRLPGIDVPDMEDRGAQEILKELAKDDPAYMEAYLQLLAERENTTNAMAWYEKMSGSQYQRAAEDLRKAGLNPYLALQSLGGAGSGSVSPAGTWSTSPYANKVAKDKAQTDRDKLGISIAGIITSILAVIAMMA